MLPCFIDTETRSPVAIQHGTAKYATQAEVITIQWALGNERVQVWDILSGRPMPPKLLEDCRKGDFLIAHKASFDRPLLKTARWWPKEFHDPRKWRCTMALALAHGLPGGLDKLCEIFKIDAESAKDKRGKELIQIFCKPNKTGAYNDRTTHPAEWKEFLIYATSDISAMRSVFYKLPKWNWTEREIELWHLDQDLNDRGIAIDTEFAESAVRATTAAKKTLGDRTDEITEGVVQRTTQRDMLLGYLLLEYGVELPNLQAETIERRLEDPELPEFVKELLRIRLQASKASTSKYRRVLQMEVAGRLHHSMVFCGANRTGRWNGVGFQPLNLPRPTHKKPEIEVGIAAMKAGCETLICDDVMAIASSAIRGVIIPSPGNRLVISDLSNIEGRKLAWLANEEWKLTAFREFDEGIGHDLYKIAYARAFNISPEDVDDLMRQIGKVMELALGYQGGVGAFVTMVATYGIDLEEMARACWDVLPAHIKADALGVWHWAKDKNRTFGLTQEVYIVCESLKRLWREAHPMTETLWHSTELAAKNAIQNPGIEFTAGRLSFDRKGAWLRMKLPSGRYLCYPDPRIIGGKITYVGVNSYTKQWCRMSTYGGKLVENGDQASSRDVIASAVPRALEAGYPLVLIVHDELVADCPDKDCYNDIDLSKLLATNADWNFGLPLAAKGSTTYRYGKS